MVCHLYMFLNDSGSDVSFELVSWLEKTFQTNCNTSILKH